MPVMTPLDPSEVARIVRIVAAHFDVSPEDVMGPSRKSALVWARWTAQYVVRTTVAGAGLVAIGEAFGRDHTSIMNGIAQVKERTETDGPFRAHVVAVLGSVVMMSSDEDNRRTL